MQQGLHIRNLFPSDYLAESEVVHKMLVKKWNMNGKPVLFRENLPGQQFVELNQLCECFLNDVRRIILSSICLWQRKYGLPQHAHHMGGCSMCIGIACCSMFSDTNRAVAPNGHQYQLAPSTWALLLRLMWYEDTASFYFASIRVQFLFFWIEFDFCWKGMVATFTSVR